MTKKLFSLVLFCLCILLSSTSAEAQYRRSYQIYLSLGQEALQKKDYRKAYFYFDSACQIAPSDDEALRYLHLTKRLLEGRTREAAASTKPRQIPKAKTTGIYIPSVEIPSPKSPAKQIPVTNPMVQKPGPKEEPISRTIELNEELWQSQPDTAIEIEMFKSVVLEGANIKQFLMVTPGAIAVKKIDSQHLLLTAQNRGVSFFHLWQDSRRWTFRVSGVIPYNMVAASRLREQLQWETYEEPFTFLYNNDWSSFYRGRDFGSMERKGLNFRQWMGLYGQTPYGKFDSSMQITKFQESTEVTGYGVGLTNAHIGSFKDFTIRGFDTSKELSELSLPGKYFRGILLEGRTLDNKLGYVYLRGQDRAVYSFLASGINQLQRSYVEGMQLTLYPDKNQNYSANFARGFGEARPSSLKDRVYSLEGEQHFGKTRLNSEVGYDENSLAYIVRPEYKSGAFTGAIKFRDIEKDYQTISGPPAGQGEVGGLMTFNWTPPDFMLSSYLDLYRDRKLFNQEHPDAINIDYNTSLQKNIDDTSKWLTDLYYFDTPGLLSTSRDVRIINGYDKSIPFFTGRTLTTSLRQTYQRSRSTTTPSSEFDRYALALGFQTMLIENLSYYVNFEQSWVTDIFQREKGVPQVLTTGLSYSRPIVDKLSGYVGLYYRDEEKTEKARSFLSGEDSLTNNLGLTYQPTPGLQIFLDAYLRNVWAENPERQPYKEAEARAGCRYDWDTPFAWNPAALVLGKVYKDMNGNGLQDKNEGGVPGIGVKVGKKSLKTNANGEYQTEVKAKKVLVGLDVESLPPGYVATGKMTREVVVVNRGIYRINFGLTTQSGIYGAVFYDANQNGSADTGDKFIANVKITLDGTQTALSDASGGYFFGEIAPGKHVLIIDLNSIPLTYLPTVKLKNDIQVTEGTTALFNIPLKKK